MWRQIGIFTLTQFWQYSRPIDGILFRVKHLNVTGTRGQIAQCVLDQDSLQLFEKQQLLSSNSLDLFEFVTPLEPGKRRIAVRADSFSTPWRVAIECYEGNNLAPDYLTLHNAHLSSVNPHPQYLAFSTLTIALAPKADTSTVNIALAAKADTSIVNTALATKADATATTTALAAKADTSTVNTALAAKADAAATTTALAAKADTSTVNTALATKADATATTTALAAKADTTTVNTALATKADATATTTALAAKADTSTVNTALATKADAAATTTALAAKADTSTVNTALATKADAAATTTALATKADTSTVNTALATKADTATVNTALATKADAVATTAALATKAEATATTTALAAKADAAAITTALAAKADTSTVNTALATKADAAATTTALAAKADTSTVNTALATKADAAATTAAITAQSKFQRRSAEISSDFIGGFGEWNSTASGVGAANSISSLTSTAAFAGSVAPGIAQQTTGSTATGRAALASSPTAFRLGDTINGGLTTSVAQFRAIFMIPIVSDSVESFIYRCGFIDNDSAESTDGCFLRVNANASAQFVCRSNNVETAVTIANTPTSVGFYNVQIVVSSSTLAKLTIFDGTQNTEAGAGTGQSYTLTTNIPAASTRLTGAGDYLQKTLGVTPRTINLDFMYAGMSA